MKLTARQQTFLAAVTDFNDRYNAVCTGGSVHPLVHSFWSGAEIAKASDIQHEWGVSNSLVPFYGDWHTLICLLPHKGTIQLLDDDRRVVFEWGSIEEFVRCLELVPEKPIDSSGVISSESWLDF